MQSAPLASPRGNVAAPSADPTVQLQAENEALRAALATANANGNQVLAQLQAAQQAAASASSAVSSSRVAPAAAPSRLKGPTPPTFRGEVGHAVDTWLRSMQKQFDFFGLTEFPDEHSRIRYAALYLEGAAMEWWEQLPSRASVVTFAEFETALRLRFRPMQAAHVARQRLAALKQRGRVSGYCSLFLTELMPIKDMAPADQIFHFRQGLDHLLAIEVLKKDPKTLHEAMDHAVAAESYLGLGRGNSGGHRGGASGYHQGQGAHMGAGASAAAATNGYAPMEISNINHDAYAEEQPPVAATPPPPSSSSSTETAALLAAMQKMQHQLLALQQQKPSSAGGKVPGLKPGDIDRLRAEGRCFNCKEKGHSKRDCTKSLRLKW